MPTRPSSIRRALLRAGCVAALGIAPLAHAADPYPTRPLRIIVGYGTGGTADSLGRLLADKLSARLGQPVVVENKPGAGGMIGTDATAKAAPDGYTITLASIGITLYPYIYPKVPYDVSKDLVPIAHMVSAPNFMAVSANSPIKSVKEFIAAAKAQPNKLTFGTPGAGSTPFLSGEVFKKMAGVEMVHVPYKGSAPAVMDLAAGTISVMFDNATLPLIRAGKLRGLAVSTAKRSPAAPDLPTLAEAGLPGYDITSWYGVLAPAGTPPAIVQRLNAEVNAIMQMPDVRERFATMGVDPVGGTPDEFGAYIQKELRAWKVLIKDSGMKLEM
jgi:tripartite-type tricarboxylate transporter receptor subunit TctC